MKSVAFIRKTWRKKDKDKDIAKRNQDAPLTERVMMVPGSEPHTPSTLTFEIPVTMLSRTMLDNEVQSRSQDMMAFQTAPVPASNNPTSSNNSSTSSLPEDEITTPSSAVFPDRHDLGYCRGGGVVWNYSHGPPKNTVHGPPNLNLYSPVSGMSPKSAGGTPPVRPPRPPPLNLYPNTTKRPMNTGVPPRFMTSRAITFALPPNPRAHSSTELASTILHSSSEQPTASEPSGQSLEAPPRYTPAAAPPRDKHAGSHREDPDNLHAAANLSLSLRYDHLPPTAPRTPHLVLGRSDNLFQEPVYQNGRRTSSTPHLLFRDGQEVSPIPLTSSASSAGRRGGISDFPLSLFPQPPLSPTFAKKKNPKNLVLHVNPPNAPLPPPSIPSPSDRAPPDKPTVLRPGTPRTYSSLSRHLAPRPIPPPLYDPPSTPLPTPPASPSAHGTASPSSLRSLRSVKSANHLRSEMFAPPPLSPAHRVTFSEPRNLSEATRSIDGTRRRMQFLSEARYEAQPFVDCQPAISNTQTQWGYAL